MLGLWGSRKDSRAILLERLHQTYQVDRKSEGDSWKKDWLKDFQIARKKGLLLVERAQAD